MNTEELHKRATEIADMALTKEANGETEKAKALFKNAFELEKEAALSTKEQPGAYSASFLFKNAASLAMNCEEYREAGRLIRFAFYNTPPPQLEKELSILLEKVKFKIVGEIVYNSPNLDWGDENVLIREFRNGNKEAFRYFYHLYYPGLASFADKLINNSEEAKDIVTESFVKLWRRCYEFKTMADIRPVLYTITRHACIDFIRLNQRQEGLHRQMVHLSQNEDYGESSLVKAELFQKLQTEIEKMPETMKRIFMLAYEEGLSTTEIAQKLNLAEDTIRVQKSRAIKLLKKLLGDKGLLG